MKRTLYMQIPIERIIIEEAAQYMDRYADFLNHERAHFIAASLRALGRKYGHHFETEHIHRLIEGKIRK
jgi:hypothetical protein